MRALREVVRISVFLVLLIPVAASAQDKRDYGKLSSHLHRIAVAAERGERLGSGGSRWIDESQNVTAVIVLAPESSVSEIEPVVRAAGGTIEASSGELVKVKLPATALREVSRHRGVLRMRTPFKPSQKVTSQGVDTIHAPDYRSRKGTEGAGVTIGVLDTQFARAEELLGTELPEGTAGTDFVLERLSQMEGTHGTACAEIIHDVAPGAALILAGFEDDVTWGAAVDELVNLGVRIISHSIGFDNVYVPDGNHFFARKVDEAVSRGVLFVTAGGNEADKYYQGPWRDENGNGYLDNSTGGEVIPILSAGGATVALRWDDPFGQSIHDYDLLVVNDAFLANPELSATNPNIIASSADLQSGSQDPVERVDFDHSGIAYILVLHDANSPLQPGQRFWIWSSVGVDPSQQTGIGTLTLPADARGALAVAAVGWDTRTLEGFSSRGPTADGRVKPDVAGPDRVTTVTFDPFPGTSAATPHVSGAAALILAANPGMSVSDLRRALEESGDLLGYPGRNNDIGAGLIDLHRAR
jgi:subtilisin family serine protease